MDALGTLDNGRYTLVTRLGEGGMATVYRAWDHRFRLWRAVKILSAQYGQRKKLRARFDAEARTMAALEHPNVVHVYDIGVEGDVPYIVMELCEGGSPVDWIEANGPMPPRLAVEVTVQICAGLAAAHAQGVVHRDVKPHNVLVTSKGICKVTDFGIAHMSDPQDSAMTKTGTVMGTLGYMAPEQRYDAKSVDPTADVYSVGATLFTLLTGQTKMELFAAAQDDTMLADVHPELVPVILKACAYRREQRYPTMDDLQEALIEVGPRLPPNPPWTPPLARPAGEVPPIPAAPPANPTLAARTATPATTPTVDAEQFEKSSGTPAPASGTRLKPRATGARPTPRPDVPIGAAPALRAAVPSSDSVPDYAATLDPTPEPTPTLATRAAQMAAAPEVPEYAAEPPPPTQGAKPYTIGLEDGEGQRLVTESDEDDAESGGPQKVDPGSAVPYLVELATQTFLALLEVLMGPGKLLAGPAALMAVGFVVVLYLGTTEVSAARDQAVVATDGYLQTVAATEGRVVDDLEAAGANVKGLRQWESTFVNASDRKQKIEAAAHLLHALHAARTNPQVDMALGRVGMRQDVDLPLRKMDSSKEDYETAVAAWQAAVSGKKGGLAVAFHVAQSPPDDILPYDASTDKGP